MADCTSDSHSRKIIASTLDKAKSAVELSEELALPMRSIYRYVEELLDLGLLTVEHAGVIDSGGKRMFYRSMVKSITVRYEGDILEVDLIPNEGILGRFMRFWSYMGRP